MTVRRQHGVNSVGRFEMENSENARHIATAIVKLSTMYAEPSLPIHEDAVMRHRSNVPFGCPGGRMEIAGPGSVKREYMFPRQGDFCCRSDGGTLSPPNFFFLARFECTGLKKEINCLCQGKCQLAGQNLGSACARTAVADTLDCSKRFVIESWLINHDPFRITFGITVRRETFSVSHAARATCRKYFHFFRKMRKFIFA